MQATHAQRSLSILLTLAAAWGCGDITSRPGRLDKGGGIKLVDSTVPPLQPDQGIPLPPDLAPPPPADTGVRPPDTQAQTQRVVLVITGMD